MDSLESLKQEIMEEIDIYRVHKYAAPFIGENYLSSPKRTLVVGYEAEVDEADLPKDDNPNNYRVSNFYSKLLLPNNNFSYPESSYPSKVILGNKSSSFTLRNRIMPFLSAGGVNDIAFCYYIPRFKIRGVTRIGSAGIDRRQAFSVFSKLIDLLKPTHVLFYGKSACSEDASALLKKNNIAFDIVALRADSVGIKISQGNQVHGLNRFLRIKEQIQNNIDSVPPILRGVINDILDEINYMESLSARAGAAEALKKQTSEKIEFLRNIVAELKRIDKNMLVKDVATLLNANGFRTARGGEFEPYSRGIYTLIETAKNALMQSENEEDRELAGEMELRFVRESNGEDTVSAVLLATPMERNYGYKSESLNVSFATAQEIKEVFRIAEKKIESTQKEINALHEEIEKDLGTVISSVYATKNDLKD
ncbi:hypothetical protein [uncultured Fibrobacter sp.]|uniref:hypothetical protein n=1 Tax=uncultured Fibrobacter sp. TaxID=261512 RepID=UPI0025D08159|nr:hypothetical protein [uncultured Fibrobacter sp.]